MTTQTDTAEDAYKRALAMPLDRKIEQSIELLRMYSKTAQTWDMFEPWYHACTSFGKDSVVMTWLLQRSGVPFKLYNSITTIDPPELIQFGRKHFPNAIRARPDKALLTRLWQDQGQGPPTRLSRWCCEIYKEQGCKGQIKVFGVRSTESQNRKNNWKQWTPIIVDKSWVVNPILYWTDEDVWTVIKSERLPYCSLYDEGFKRLGCIGCPMAQTKGRLKEFARWPNYERAWKRSFSMFWDRWHGVPRRFPAWYSCEGKYDFKPLPGEKTERRYVEEREREEDGFWTLRRWYDLRGYKTWQDLWHWWMEDEDEQEGCTMGLH